MKLDISYNGKVADSLSGGEIAIIPKEKEFTTDVIIKTSAEPNIKLKKYETPSISLDTLTLKITDTSGKAKRFSIYSNGEKIATTDNNTATFSVLNYFTQEGTYNVTVTAIADGYGESEQSNEVELVLIDLTDTTWYVESGWEAEAGYLPSCYILGTFNGSTMNGLSIGYRQDTSTLNVRQATKNWLIHINTIDWMNGYFSTSNDTAFTLVITGGTGAFDPKLREWLETYGTKQ